MTDDKIRPLRQGIVGSPDKQQFLDAVATAYDKLTGGPGPPVALVFAFVAETGEANPSYITLSKVDDRNLLYLARAVMALNSDYHVWDRDANDTNS